MPPKIDPARLARIRAQVLAAAALMGTEGCERIREMMGNSPPQTVETPNSPVQNYPPPSINNPPMRRPNTIADAASDAASPTGNTGSGQ